MHKNTFIFLSLLMISLSFSSYSVGQTISIEDQQTPLYICNGHELNGDTDGEMSLYDYNGDHNGGSYYVFYIDMSASW